jgi:uncharacterized MAPEG superfamily protein
MTIAYFCILLAFLTIYLAKVPTAIAMYKLDNRYDNSHPRDQQFRLTGWGKRAASAHYNSFEIFPAFAVSVIIANIINSNMEWLNILSITFVISRLFYIAFYIYDYNSLRSAVWGIGFFSVIGIFLLPLLY